jgi:hypothetical protein
MVAVIAVHNLSQPCTDGSNRLVHSAAKFCFKCLQLRHHLDYAVKGQVEQDPLVRTAFEKMVSTGTSAHHGEHILGALLFETEWETARAVEAGKDIEKLQKTYIHKLQKLSRDSAFRKKLTKRFTADHSAFE